MGTLMTWVGLRPVCVSLDTVSIPAVSPVMAKLSSYSFVPPASWHLFRVIRSVCQRTSGLIWVQRVIHQVAVFRLTMQYLVYSLTNIKTSYIEIGLT